MTVNRIELEDDHRPALEDLLPQWHNTRGVLSYQDQDALIAALIAEGLLAQHKVAEVQRALFNALQTLDAMVSAHMDGCDSAAIEVLRRFMETRMAITETIH